MSSLWRLNSRMLKKHLNQRCELGDMAISVGRCLRTTPWDNNALGVALGTTKTCPKHESHAWDNRGVNSINFFNTCLNGASEESIGIYAHSRCR